MMRRNWRWVGAAAIPLLAFALRVHELGAKDLSADEAFGVMMIQQPFFDLWRTGQDLHPPLYHALAWIVARLAGESAFALRFAALIPGVLTAALAVAIGRRASGAWAAGLLAGALTAISPALIYWSQDARLYTLLACLAAASMYGFLRLTHNPTRSAWTLYLLATLAALYTQYGAFWVIAAQNLAALALWRGRLCVWLAGQMLLALAFLPWALGQAAFLAQPGNLRAGGFSLARAPEDAAAILRFWFLGYTEAGLPQVYIIGLALAALGWRRTRHTANGAALMLWAALTFVLVIAWGGLLNYFDPRFAIAGIVPLFALIAAETAGAWREHYARGIVNAIPLAALIAGMALSALNWYRQPETAKGEYAAVMARIAASARSGDRILFSNPGQIALIFVHAPDSIPHALLDVERVNRPGTDAYLGEVVGDAARVWLVEYGDPSGFDAMRLVPNYLSRRGLRALEFDYDSGKVMLFDLRRVDAEWQPLDARFGGAIRLEAYRIAVDAEAARISLRWIADASPAADYHVGCHVLNEAGMLVAQTDSLPRGGAARTVDWAAGDVIEDGCAVPLPPDLPPGSYTAAVVLYTYPELVRADVTGADAAPGDLAVLTTFAR
jgi:hypothetical protein